MDFEKIKNIVGAQRMGGVLVGVGLGLSLYEFSDFFQYGVVAFILVLLGIWLGWAYGKKLIDYLRSFSKEG